MSFIPLNIPPGVFRNGTLYQAKGRWYNSNLVRWASGALGPIGGWERIQVSGSQNDLEFPSTFENAAWTKVNLTATDGVEEAPDGTMTGASLSDADTGGVGTVSQLEDITAIFGKRFAQVYVKKAITAPTMAAVRVSFSGGSVSANETATILFNPATGAYALQQTEEDGDVIAVYVVEDENDWWKITAVIAIAEDADYTDMTLTLSPAYSPDLETFTPDPTLVGEYFFWQAGFYTSAPGDVFLGSPVLGLFPWNDNDSVARLAIGTTNDCWHYAQGALLNITPGGFVSGESGAVLASGVYGFGSYGSGSYSVGDPNQTVTVEAQTWKFDAFGQYLVAHALSDGRILWWDLESNSVLEEVGGSPPTDNASIVVTPERFLVALGSDGDPREIKWPDQESLDDWTPTPENQAGDFRLPGAGTILNGLRGRGETLIWTSRDLWKMVYVGPPLVYRFEQVGNNCGPISRRAMVIVDGGKALWMGQKNFYGYDGFTAPIPSSVADDVFQNINTVQASRVFALTIAAHNEVWWFYPSIESEEVNRYVVYNWVENTWAVGRLARSAGTDRGARDFPVMGDRFGRIFDHEIGSDYPATTGNTQLVPFVESGPIEIADGENRMRVRYIIPDANTLGAMNARLYSREYPTAPEAQSQLFNPANPTSTRVSGREVRIRVEQALPNWRLGNLRLDVVAEGQR